MNALIIHALATLPNLPTDEDVQALIDPNGTLFAIIKTTLCWLAIIGLFVGIEKAPIIKINPISWLSNLIFKSVNEKLDEVQKDVDTKFTDMNNILNTIETKEDKNRFATIRWEILSFRNSLHNGDMYTEVEYQHILDDCDEYKQLHDKYGFTNGYLEDAEKEIIEHHDKHKDLNVKYF